MSPSSPSARRHPGTAQIPQRVARRAAEKWAPGVNGCWISTYSTGSHGYSQIGWWEDGRNHTVTGHRASWTHFNGPIPVGMYVDHVCFEKRCVNPAHLRLVTNKQNGEHQQGAFRTNVGSGVRGVYTNKSPERPWCAKTKHNGLPVYLGSFATAQEAEAAVIAARAQLFTHDDAPQQRRRDPA